MNEHEINDIVACMITMRQMGTQNVIDCCITHEADSKTVFRIIEGAMRIDMQNWVGKFPVVKMPEKKPEDVDKLDFYKIPIIPISKPREISPEPESQPESRPGIFDDNWIMLDGLFQPRVKTGKQARKPRKVAKKSKKPHASNRVSPRVHSRSKAV